MDLSLLDISQFSIQLLLITFLMGFVAHLLTLPPMLGFLASGFVFHAFGLQASHELQQLADLGVTLMLFTIGLKLDWRNLLKIQIWGVASAHILFSILFFSVILMLPVFSGIQGMRATGWLQALIISFALSFSSTVFAIKVFDNKGDMGALYAKIAIGILIIQDIVAVIFLTVSTAKLPSFWALLLLLLPFARPLLYKVMDIVGHGELLVFYSLLLALGGAALFELVGMKADLGALVFGVLLGGHTKAAEISERLYHFKDLFLVAFFVSIGMAGAPSVNDIIIALFLSVLLVFKGAGFFFLFIKTRLTARTAFMSAVSLSNYSEFGLIVGAIAVSNQWMSLNWLIIIAIALSLSFVINAPLNQKAYELYAHFSPYLVLFQSTQRLPEERELSVGKNKILILGMGRVGQSVYQDISQTMTDSILGVDFDSCSVQKLQQQGINVVYADVMDKDFWHRLDLRTVEVIFVNMPECEKNRFSVEQIRQKGFSGKIAVIANYPEEELLLQQAGADYIYDFYTQAGLGFCEYVKLKLQQSEKIAEQKIN